MLDPVLGPVLQEILKGILWPLKSAPPRGGVAPEVNGEEPLEEEPLGKEPAVSMEPKDDGQSKCACLRFVCCWSRPCGEPLGVLHSVSCRHGVHWNRSCSESGACDIRLRLRLRCTPEATLSLSVCLALQRY